MDPRLKIVHPPPRTSLLSRCSFGRDLPLLPGGRDWMHKGNLNHFPRCGLWSSGLPARGCFRLVDGLAFTWFSRPAGDLCGMGFRLGPHWVWSWGYFWSQDNAVVEWHGSQCPSLPFALSVVSSVPPFQDSPNSILIGCWLQACYLNAVWW